jgi:hypothetical protein
VAAPARGARQRVQPSRADARAVLLWRQVEAEALSDVSEKHGVPSVPFFLFFKARATRLHPLACVCRLLMP